MNDCVLRIITHCYSIILDTLIAIQNITTEVKTNNAKRLHFCFKVQKMREKRSLKNTCNKKVEKF